MRRGGAAGRLVLLPTTAAVWSRNGHRWTSLPDAAVVRHRGCSCGRGWRYGWRVVGHNATSTGGRGRRLGEQSLLQTRLGAVVVQGHRVLVESAAIGMRRRG